MLTDRRPLRIGSNAYLAHGNDDNDDNNILNDVNATADEKINPKIDRLVAVV